MKKITLIVFLYLSTGSFFSGLLLAQGITEPKGMTVEDFMKNTNQKNKLVFVNFKADWCVVCKRQEPILEEVHTIKKDSIEMMVLNMEDNPLIAEHFEVDGLPLHFLYFEGTRVWDRMGIINRTELLEVLRLYERILIKKK